jgi:hypothetical protein
VDNGAHTDDVPTLQRKLEALPWSALETDSRDLRSRHLDRPVRFPDARW